MQNSECRMQYDGISFGNDINLSAKPTQSFCIQHFAFCIEQHKLPAKLQFEFEKICKTSIDYLRICGMIMMYKYVWDSVYSHPALEAVNNKKCIYKE